MSGASAVRPPNEALAFWRSKVQLGDSEFAALDQAAKNRAFAVSGLAAGDLLSEVHASLGRALTRGESLATWKKGLASELEKLGWTGPNAYRANLIYRTNMQGAYQAGRWAQFEQTRDVLNLLVYSAVNDSRTRRAHRALHGRAYPMDHEFWKRFYPPNGYNCRCTARPMSREQARDFGVTVGEEIPEAVETPSGLVRIASDPGWSGNIGRDWLSGLSPQHYEGKIELGPSKVICPEGRRSFADYRCIEPLGKVDRRHVRGVKPEDILPKGLSPERYVRSFLEEFGLADIDASLVHPIPGVPDPVVIGKGFFLDKATGGWKSTWTDKGPYMRLLARTILDPFEVWEDVVKLPSGPNRSLRLIRLFELPGKDIGGYCAFHLIHGRLWQAATAFAPKANRSQQAIYDYLEQYRRGTLVHWEELG